MHDEQSQHVKKITLGLVLGWGLGVLAAIAGILLLFSYPLSGIVALFLSAVLLPPANKFIAEKFKFSISGGLKAVVVIILLALFGISIPPSHQGSTENIVKDAAPTQKDQTSQPVQQQAASNAPAPTATQTDNQNTSPASSETVSQKNAVRAAHSYLNFTAFSHDGLVAQLEYDQFSHADAVYGADNSGADWNEQAAIAAKKYMAYSAFSRGSLIAQLEYDKFTEAQAEYGANAVGL